MASPEITPETIVSVPPGLHDRRVGNKVFVLDKGSVMHTMDNDVAVAIWDALRSAPNGGLTVIDIAEAIVAGFEVGLEEATRDALDFACLLHARGILSASD